MLRLRVIGVTGGIGSGKSTVSKILSGLGAKLVDADIIARDIVAKGQKALDEIAECFGREVLDKNGELDRKVLSAIVFKSKEKLDALNSITHKYIAQKIIERINSFDENDTVVIDAAIPIKKGFLDVVDEVWVVTASKGTRIKRVMTRSGLSYDEVLERINSQLNDDYYFGISDIVIYNNGVFEELENLVKKNYYKTHNS